MPIPNRPNRSEDSEAPHRAEPSTKASMAEVEFESCSAEATLAVPLDVVFRVCSGVGQSRSKGGGQNLLFTSSEITTLLKIEMLSHELDCLLSLVYDSLERVHKMKEVQTRIRAVNSVHPYLRALMPLVHVHRETAEVALKHATNEGFGIKRILKELDLCAHDLAKCAEQNLTMASQIENFLGSNSALSRDKRAIAEIEEAVSERIQNLSDLAFGSVSDRSLIADNAEPFVSMKELCERLFPKTTPEYTESQFDAAETLATMLN